MGEIHRRTAPRVIALELATFTAVSFAAWASAQLLLALCGVPATASHSHGAPSSLSCLGLDTPLVTSISYWLPLAVSSAALAVSSPHIVRRTRHVWDFVLTVHLFIALLRWLIGASVPGAWWLAHTIAGVPTTLLGERLCLREEAREISIA